MKKRYRLGNMPGNEVPALRGGARRRHSPSRSALLICAASYLGMKTFGLIGALLSVRFGMLPLQLFNTAGSVLFFGGAAYLGVMVIDGDQHRLLRLRRLSASQALWYGVSGALTPFLTMLLAMALNAALGIDLEGVYIDGEVLYLFTLCSCVIAPVCEELFFRGYLMGALALNGRKPAVIASTVIFAVFHSVSVGTPGHIAMGVFFALAAMRSESLLASMIMHMAHNAVLVLLSLTGLSVPLETLNPFSAAVMIAACTALFYTWGRAWRARGVRETMTWPPRRLTRGQRRLIILAALLTAAACVMQALAMEGLA